LDFKNDHEVSRLIINDFVSQNTNNLIKDLLKAGTVKPETASVLVNCIYFYGNWLEPFKEHATHPFPWLGQKNKKFLAMNQKNENLKILRNHPNFGDFELLRIPYTERVGFYVLLDRKAPDASSLTKNNFEILNKFSEMRKNMVDHGARGDKISITLPKFEMSSEHSPKDIVQKLGFPMITNDLTHEALEVDDVIHKAVIKVDEKGTEAAAATAVMMLRCAMIERGPPPFIVDRPFLYFIFDDEVEKMLFSGFMYEPEFV